MQTASILSTIDNQAGAAKTNKQPQAAQGEGSFNHYLNREISAKKSNGAGNANTATSASPLQPPRTPDGPGKTKTKDGATSEDEQKPAADLNEAGEAGAAGDMSVGAQIIALVGNLGQYTREPETTTASTPQSGGTPEVASVSAPGSGDAGRIEVIPEPERSATQKSPIQAVAPENDTAADATAGSVAATSDKSTTAPEQAIRASNTGPSGATGISGDKVKMNVTSAEHAADPESEVGMVADKFPQVPLQRNRPETADERSLPTSKVDVPDAPALPKASSAPQAAPETGISAAIQSSGKNSASGEKFAEQFAHAKLNESGTEIVSMPAPAPGIPQQVGAPDAAAAGNLATQHIAPRVGTAGWDKAVGQKIVWMAAGSMQSAELTLNPPDLGPLQVVLSVSNDQANATFTAAQPEVREALESALPRLRQMMSDAGVQLTGFSVSAQTSGQGQAFPGQQTDSPPRPGSPGTATETSTQTPVSQVARSQVASGLVDTFA